MTRLPLDDRNVVGVPGPRYEHKDVCSHPFCDERNPTPGKGYHHIWRRSFLGGGFNWVKLPDGKVVGNVVYLCREHHREITENKAWISLLEATAPLVGHIGLWYAWNDDNLAQNLDPQPPLSLQEAEETPSIKIAVKSGGDLSPGENCPTCERRIPHPKKETSPATTVVKSWRLPAAEKEAREETIAATAEHLGISTKEKFWMDKLVLTLCVIALQGPSNPGIRSD